MMPRQGDTVLYSVRGGETRAAMVLKVNEAHDGAPPSLNLLVFPLSEQDAQDKTYGGQILNHVTAAATGGPVGWQTRFT